MNKHDSVPMEKKSVCCILCIDGLNRRTCTRTVSYKRRNKNTPNDDDNTILWFSSTPTSFKLDEVAIKNIHILLLFFVV